MTKFHEVKQRDIEAFAGIDDKADAATNGDFDDYSFNSLFGDKLRIVIPLGKDSALNDDIVKKLLKEEGYDVDLKKGTATIEIKTKKGPQKQTMKLGRLFKKLSRKGPQWQAVLHWWEMKADKTKKMGDPTGVSIVISRSPIDILRMSDHEELHSCHAPPGKPGHIGRYWKCAAQESLTGGAVAYVVKNSDLQSLSDWQASEIFKDNDRDIEGVEPLERLRLRRFTAYQDYQTGPEEETDILVPELSTYGIRHVDFRKTVVDWARKAQNVDFDKLPDWDNAELHGGSYQDNPASELWSSFFKTYVSGGKTSEDVSDEGENSPEYLQERADEQIAAREFKHVNVDAQVQDDDEVTLFWSGEVTFTFPKSDFIKIPTERDVEWRQSLPPLRKSFEDFDFSTGDNEPYVGENNDQVYLSIPISEEPPRYDADGPLDLFESWLDWVDSDIENEYTNHWATMRAILINNGFLKDNWKFSELKHFKTEKEGNDIWVKSNRMWIGDLKGVESKNIKNDAYGLSFPYHSALESNATVIFPNFVFFKTDQEARSPWHHGRGHNFDRQFGSTDVVQIDTDNLHVNTKDEIIKYPSNVYIWLNINVKPDKYKIYYNSLKHIDEYWDTYAKRARNWWKTVKPMLMASTGVSNPGAEPVGGTFAARKELPQLVRKSTPEPAQMELPFKDWLAMSELPLL